MSRNYYANKQEEVGYVITSGTNVVATIRVYEGVSVITEATRANQYQWSNDGVIKKETYIDIIFDRKVSKKYAASLYLKLDGDTSEWLGSEDWVMRSNPIDMKESTQWRYIYRGTATRNILGNTKAMEEFSRENISLSQFELSKNRRYARSNSRGVKNSTI